MTVPGRVTIAIPTLNRSALAVRAISSALAQTYRDVEVLVSDDLSVDDTFDRVSEISDSRLVVFRQEKRLGLVRNFDFCLRHASGEFFLLLGDDDVLASRAMECLVAPFRTSHPGSSAADVGLVWCPCCIVAEDGHLLWTTEAGPAVESPVSMLVGLFDGTYGPRLSSILLRTEDAIAVGGFQERHGDLCDIGAWGLAALRHRQVICVQQPLVQYRNHLGSTTSRSAARKWRELAVVVHADLLASAQQHATAEEAHTLARAKRNYLSTITLCILIQTIGRPGWIRNACREALRSPGILFTPCIARKLLKDGWKLLRIRRRSPGVRPASSSAAL